MKVNSYCYQATAKHNKTLTYAQFLGYDTKKTYKEETVYSYPNTALSQKTKQFGLTQSDSIKLIPTV